MWARGHMLASASRTASRELNKTTFYFTNMLPQNQSQNSAQWASLEGKERVWAQQRSISDTLYVACGPVYSQSPSLAYDRDGKQIPVPEATFKVFLRKDKRDGNWYSIGFIMPNRSLGATKYSDYAVPVTEVEQKTGLEFFTHLDKSKAVAIKSQNDQSHWR
jgi:endonuclease G